MFSLFPTVTKAETTNVTWKNGSVVTSLKGSVKSDRATMEKADLEINNVVAIALDLDNDKIDWYKNRDSHEANFGASDFKYPIPEGFYLFKIQAHLKHLIRRIQMRPLNQLVTVQF